MATVTLNEVEIYLDVRSTSGWEAVTRVIPKGFNCVEYTDDGKCKMKIGDGVKSYSELPYVGGDLDIEGVNSAIATALEDYYTKDDTDEAIKSAVESLGTVFVLKGKASTVDELPAEGNNAGDIYLVGAESDTEFWEYYWTGTMWDYMGKTVDVDLSNYYTKSEVDTTIGAIDERVSAVEKDYVKSTDKLILNCRLS